MHITPMNGSSSVLEAVTAFHGLDCRASAPLGWFSDDRNVTSDTHPLLTVRPSRGLYSMSPELTGAGGGLVIEDRLCVADHAYLWIDDERYDLGLSDGPKRLIPFSYYLLIFPDKKYINVLDPQDSGSMEEEAALFGLSDITVSVASAGGSKPQFVSKTEPVGTPGVDIEYLSLWYKPRVSHESGADEPAALYRQINAAPDDNGVVWQEIESYLLFERDAYNNGILHGPLSEGEFVVLDGFSTANAGPVGDVPSERDLAEINGAHTVESVRFEEYGDRRETDSFLVRGILQDRASYTFANDEQHLITVRRAVPDLQYAVSCDGRLYGAFRGVSSISGEEVNEIYISAAGDFKRFFRAEDTSADPLIMSVIEPGAFRGAAVVGGVVTFFKDRKILTVGGNTPASFYINTYDGDGPSGGCEASLCTIGGNAVYLAGGRVLAYYGGSVSILSESLGNALVGASAAVGAGYAGKYYLALTNAGGERCLYVYDTVRGLWHRESVPAAGICSFAEHARGLFLFSDDGRIRTIGDHAALGATVPAEESMVPWMWESGMIGLETPQKKYITKAEVRLLIETGAVAEMWIQYDSNRMWHPVWRAEAGKTRTVMSRMKPHRCDHMRIILRGEGKVTLLGVFLTIEREDDR